MVFSPCLLPHFHVVGAAQAVGVKRRDRARRDRGAGMSSDDVD